MASLISFLLSLLSSTLRTRVSLQHEVAALRHQLSVYPDLINWTRRKLLLEVDLPWTVPNPADIHYLYPSLLDPQSLSRNFETTGRTAYLYYMRNNAGLEPGGMDLDRDLIRMPVEFEGP